MSNSYFNHRSNKCKDIHFVGNKKRAGFDFPSYDLIVQSILIGELANRISSKEPHSAQKEIEKAIQNLNLNETEQKIKSEYLDHLLITNEATQIGLKLIHLWTFIVI